MIENLETEKIEIIKEAFEEKREIIGFAPQEMTCIDNQDPIEDVFITRSGELIDLELQMVDFDEVELAKYVELAEKLYEKNNVCISIYVLCPKTINVTAPECIIKSDAEFTIKLACYQGNPVYDIFYKIKEKVDKNMELNENDLDVLETIPMMGPKEERTKLRIECFRLYMKSQK